MSTKTLKILVWLFLIAAAIVLLASFTLINSFEVQKPYMILAALLWATSKGINIYVNRKVKKEQEKAD